MKVSLVVTKGKREGKVLPISVAQFVIGRHKECQLRASGSTISQHHCAILVRENKVLVHDFDSTNGTFVNRRRVQGEQELAPDDLLELGRLAFRIRIEAEDEEPAAWATSATEEKADESFIGNMLLNTGDSDPGILGLLEDSKCGSTIMKSPLMAEEDSDDPKPEPSGESKAEVDPPKKEVGDPSAPPLGPSDEIAKKLLEELHRSVRAKHNPSS